MDTYLIITIVIILSVVITLCLTFSVISYNNCNRKYDDLKYLYSKDIIPIEQAVKQYKIDLEEYRDQNKKYDALIKEQSDLNEKLQKNIIGTFNKTALLTNLENSCVKFAKNERDDIMYLNLNTNCISTDIYKLYTYDPINRQLIVKVDDKDKCVDAYNNTDIVLNDCITTSQKQKFNYYPLYDGGFKSTVYSKCLGYNPDSNKIELQKCGEKTNIKTKDTLRKEHLYLENS